jgi:hypothetical protein
MIAEPPAMRREEIGRISIGTLYRCNANGTLVSVEGYAVNDQSGGEVVIYRVIDTGALHVSSMNPFVLRFRDVVTEG